MDSEFIQSLTSDNFSIKPNIIKMSEKIMKKIKPQLHKIQLTTEFNNLKVIAAMRESYLSDFHLNDSTGYGYNDTGREAIENIFKAVFKAEEALVKPQIISGTHALALCLFGVLRPKDELLSVTGTPYDTLVDVITGENCGSLKDYDISYQEADLIDGKPDLKAIASKINKNTRMVLIQRSRGYSLRPALTIDEIGKLIKHIKGIKHDIICMVDNCYGEFVETKEPIEVGADLCAGSLIKNLGGGVAPTGGYVVGRKNLISQCMSRLTAPGLDKDYGPSLLTNRLTLQGLFFAPQVVGEALKGAVFGSAMLEQYGFDVYPKYNEVRGDIVTAAVLKDKNSLVSFCQGIQKAGPVDCHVSPQPWAMPGYDHEVIMAGGSFIQGSSIELSADGPIREPYAVYIQGGLNFTHAKLGIMTGLQALADSGYITI